jgi:hypothetical protein
VTERPIALPMAEEILTRLSKDECFRKAEECRTLAKAAILEPHRIMLDHIAQTWERIANGM